MPAPESATAVVSAARTDPGRKRADNQDAVAQELMPYGGIFVVADGMGGHRTGALAAQLAVEKICEVLRAEKPLPKRLVEAFEVANAVIYEAGQKPESRGMGTTATALWLDLPYALIAHVGDSRAYLLRKGQLSQLTQDHSWVAERVRQGLLTEEEAKNHRWRNVITNALGSFPEVRVDLLGVKVEPGDIFLLCSDGLSGVLEDRVLAEMLRNHPPHEAAERLVQLANEWGGPDNISVVVVSVGDHIPNLTRTYSPPLEGSAGPVRLQLGEAMEVVSTQVTEPPRPRSFWERWGNLILLALWLVTLGYVLFSQFSRPLSP
ncbi:MULTISPECIES: Stp1/IreP family PP2C-type Ser/Thr phosphatase [unclassified Meiothermus]|uniref:Stp1/IreP family PP2C-type Ser/Thr phosphatase n=1 Tax=unclassified Meiothermus TaxID=370471 RepID=UPI000D7CC9AD|nr:MULTISPECIES: Stp1/IreP family PP2C-type Ser/Thr phosphatase [unclassified Meiothermus]PZA05766.1 Stp1/IreP family PP2C-type Ser/Thr phosphatase [Meiothermus sp. Pnk-1]RYM32224.1 Stp1/IreP family PP2C-type Ser/Thr phosphatase [Meiothermus sp. PNK-Is4]